MNHSKILLPGLLTGLLLAACNQTPTASAPASDTAQASAASDTMAPTPAADTATTNLPADETPAPPVAPSRPARSTPAVQRPAPTPPPVASAPPAVMPSDPPPPYNRPPPSDYPSPPMGGPRSALADAGFYRAAMAGGEQEIQMSRLARLHSGNVAVQRLADMLIRDHSEMDARMSSLLRIDGVRAHDPGVIAQLARERGPSFDRHYLSLLSADHRDAIQLFTRAARNAHTDAARALAYDSLPKLRQHLDAVQRTQGSLEQTNPGGTIPVPAGGPSNAALDAAFYHTALAGGEQEIQISRLALSHSTNVAVQRLAHMLIRDHAALDAQMSSISRINGVPPKDAAAIRALGTMFGPIFDRQYLAAMLADHRDAIALFADASRNARTDTARKLASNNLPKLRQHLNTAQHIRITSE